MRVTSIDGVEHELPPAMMVEKRGVIFAVDLECPARGQCLSSDWYTRWWLANWPEFEPETFAAFDRVVTPESVVLDVGAWIGPTCFYLARKAKRVIALEPDPEAWKVLAANYQQNPWATNLSLYGCALADRISPMPFGGNGDLGNSQSAIIFRDPEPAQPQDSEGLPWIVGQQVVVPAVTIEDFASHVDLSECDVVKIDIEGGEVLLLPAMADWLTRQKPTLLLSVHWGHLSPKQARGVMTTFYQIFPVVSDLEIGAPLTLAEAISRQARSLVGEWN